MHRRPAPFLRLSLLAAAAATAPLAATPSAVAGTYTIQACDTKVGFTSPAFGAYANRGMKIKQACGAEGSGLTTGNVIRSGRVKRGAQARFELAAPTGTRFVYLDWSGRAYRRDCRYALQMYALRPDGPPKSIRNFRANQRARGELATTAKVGVYASSRSVLSRGPYRSRRSGSPGRSGSTSWGRTGSSSASFAWAAAASASAPPEGKTG
jgi:hypothetical protein